MGKETITDINSYFEIIDPVLEEIQFGIAETETSLPKAIMPGFMDSTITAQTVQEFLQKYVLSNN